MRPVFSIHFRKPRIFVILDMDCPVSSHTDMRCQPCILPSLALDTGQSPESGPGQALAGKTVFFIFADVEKKQVSTQGKSFMVTGLRTILYAMTALKFPDRFCLLDDDLPDLINT